MTVPRDKNGIQLWNGHRRRLRRRMEEGRLDTLRPHEILEIVMSRAVPRQDLSDVARALMSRFGSLECVLSASVDALCAVEGMTPYLAEWISITGELSRAYYDLRCGDALRLSCYMDVVNFMGPRLGEAARPGLWAAYIDFSFNLITYTDFGRLSDCWCADVVRRVLEEAISVRARYVCLMRFTEKSPPALDDGELPRLTAIVDTLRAADVDLVDCVVTDGREIASLRLSGQISVDRGNPRQTALHEGYGAGL